MPKPWSWFRSALIPVLVSLAAGGAVVGPPNPATAQPASDASGPQAKLVYSGGSSKAITAALDGTVLQRFSKASPYLSLSGGVLAAAHLLPDGLSSNVLGLDAKTGDLVPLHLAISPDLKRVAVAEGNDADHFQSDIWLLATRHHFVQNLTEDKASWYPSFSPDGSTIAFMRLKGTDTCTNEIRVIGIDGTDERTVVKGSCSKNFLRPIWIDSNHLVAWKWTDGTPLGLVKITVDTGKTTSLLDGPVTDFSVSRDLHRIAVRLNSKRIELYDPRTGSVTSVPGGGQLPGGQVHLSNAYELAY